MTMNRMRRKPRLTSFSAFGVGAGWQWVDSDAEIVRRLILELEDRRLLTRQPSDEIAPYVIQSAREMRPLLTQTLKELAPESGATHAVRAMRTACVTFLNRAERLRSPAYAPPFVSALERLRETFVQNVRMLADEYEITVEGPLAEALIAEDERDGGGE